jgi:protein-S-isoprenylcysteine O-methyltransferase Ste14
MIMFGFLLQWPAIVILIMLLILTCTYIRRARIEEKEAYAELAEEYSKYAANTPAFFARLR